MQNERPAIASIPGVSADQPVILAGAGDDSGALEQNYTHYDSVPDGAYVEHERHKLRTLLGVIIAGVAVLVLAGGVIVLRLQTASPATSVSSGNFGVVSVPLSGLNEPLQIDNGDTLRVDGTVRVAQSVILTPTGKPSNPIAGQLYYDKSANLLAYYNGQQFLNLNANSDAASSTGSVTNITNILGGTGNNVQLQPAIPGTKQTGNFNISGVGVAGSLQTTTLDIIGGDINLSNGRSIKSGSLQVLSTSNDGSVTTISNSVSGGKVSVQADNFTVQDADATHQNLSIGSNGAAVFSNKTDSTAAFQVQNATNKNVFTVDSSNNQIVLGNDGNTANVSVAGIRGGAASGNNITGKNLTISAGNGTGTGGSGDIVFNTATGVSNPLVTLDTIGGNEAGSTSALSWTHNTGVHPDPILLVAVNSQDNTSPATATSVTYNGIALTRVTNLITGQAIGSLWYLVNPPTGNHTVSVTFSGSSLGVGGASTTFYNVDQTDPIGGFETSSRAFANSVSTTLAGTNAGQVVFDALLARQSLGLPIPGFGQTQLYQELSDNVNAASYRTGNAGSTTMSWSGTNIGSSLNHIVIALNPEPNITPDPLTEALRITQSGTLGVSLAANETAQATISLGGTTDRSIVVNQNPDTGAGHKLTVQAGTGATGNNNGGDLLLQGGTATGTGTVGSVIVRPPSDSANAFLVQNAASSATILTVDTTNKVVTVTNLAITGHITTSGATPSIAAGTAACTTPTISVSGNDTSGIITVATGTGCAANGVLATLTFAVAFGAAPHVVLTPGSAAAQALGAYVDDATVGTTSFALGTNNTPSDATTYKWNYMVLQ